MSRFEKILWRLWLRTDDPDRWPNKDLENICPLAESEVTEYYSRWAMRNQGAPDVTSGAFKGIVLVPFLLAIALVVLIIVKEAEPASALLTGFLVAGPVFILFQPRVAWNSHFAMTRAIEEYSKGIGRRKKSIIRGIGRDVKALERARTRVQKAEARLGRRRVKDPSMRALFASRKADAQQLKQQIEELIAELNRQLGDSHLAVEIVRSNFTDALRRMGPGDARSVIVSARETLLQVGAANERSSEIQALGSDANDVQRLLNQLNHRYRRNQDSD